VTVTVFKTDGGRKAPAGSTPVALRHLSSAQTLLRIAIALPLPRLPHAQRRHQERASVLAVNFGHAIGLPVSSLAALRVAAWVHDIGKHGVPTAILDKPGPLNPEEVRVTRRHVLIGAEIAERTGFPRDVVLAIRHHHERWDGTGYPDGLAEDAIPLLARIIAITDAYDVMITSRPYHVALSADAALAELLRCAGAQFDPRLTQIFISQVLARHPLWRSRGA
jgi:putative nucleotidyltransferase with HDIG domain